MRTIVSVAAVALILFSGTAQAKTISIGTNPQGSVAYSVAAGVAKVAIEKAGLRARVVPQGGPVVTLPLVNSGELNFSVSVSTVTAFASRGADMFEGRPQDKVRAVAAVLPLRVGFFVRQDSEIKTVADLKGKRIPSKYTKQKILSSLSIAILATAGLDFEDVIGVPVPNGVRGVSDFVEGKVDAASFSIGSGKVAEANAAVKGIRYISMVNTPETLEAMRKTTPGTLIATLDPAPNLPGIVEPTNVLEAPFLINAGVDTPDDVVYKLVKALYENKATLVKSHKLFNDFAPDKMNPDLGIPVHNGALKFYKEKGL